MELPGYVINIADVLAAALLGAAIGAEREWRRHPGSLRSCVLVATAACVFARVAVDFGGNNPGAALGAIATGIGFLGGGVILREGLAEIRRRRSGAHLPFAAAHAARGAIARHHGPTAAGAGLAGRKRASHV